MRSAQSSGRTDSLKPWYLGRIRLSLLLLSNRAVTCIPSISTVPDDFERDVGVPTGTVARGAQAVPENLHLLTWFVYCRQNGWKFIQHQNISEKELNKGGLHLNFKGNQQFFKNFQMSLG